MAKLTFGLVPHRRAPLHVAAQELAANAIWNLQAERPNHIWSYDFKGSRLRNGAGLRILNVVDEFTREGITTRVDRSIGSTDVQRSGSGSSQNEARPRSCARTTVASSCRLRWSTGWCAGRDRRHHREGKPSSKCLREPLLACLLPSQPMAPPPNVGCAAKYGVEQNNQVYRVSLRYPAY